VRRKCSYPDNSDELGIATRYRNIDGFTSRSQGDFDDPGLWAFRAVSILRLLLLSLRRYRYVHLHLYTLAIKAAAVSVSREHQHL
jgi:hypothetical protein